MNEQVLAWWYYSLELVYLVYGEVEQILNQYNFYNHRVVARNDPLFEISGGQYYEQVL